MELSRHTLARGFQDGQTDALELPHSEMQALFDNRTQIDIRDELSPDIQEWIHKKHPWLNDVPDEGSFGMDRQYLTGWRQGVMNYWYQARLVIESMS